MITLTEEEVKNLTEFALNIPTKYGMSLIDFLNKKVPKIEPVEEIVSEEL